MAKATVELKLVKGIEEAQALTVGDGDLVVFHAPQGVDYGDALNEFAQAARAVVESLRALNLEVRFVVLEHGASIDVVSEADMRDLGWVRAT